jgi:hypothetical protein
MGHSQDHDHTVTLAIEVTVMNMQVTWAMVALAISGLLSSCASTPGAKPEDMSAKAHEEEAVKEAEMAQELAAKAASAEQTGIGLSAGASPAEAAELQAERHLEHAQDHLAAAEALRNAEEEACKSLPAGVRESCPLLGPIVATEATTHGALIAVRRGTDMKLLIAEIRCHIAVANTEGRQGMEHCPLYVPGVQVKQVGPTVIELSTAGEANVRELQERVAAHIGD